MNKKAVCLLCPILFIILYSKLLADPVITNVEHKESGGDVYVATGTGFGAKSPAAPILWENFEDGTIGQDLPSTGKWTALAGAGGWFSDVALDYLTIPDTSYSGTFAAYNVFKVGSTGTNETFNTSYYVFSPSDEVYYSYRWRVEATTEGDGRIIGKLGRINSNYEDPINPYNGPGVMSYHNLYPIKSPGTLAASYSNALENIQQWINPNGYPDPFKGINNVGQWHRHEMYNKISTAGVADGAVRFVSDQYTVWEEFNALTRDAGQDYQNVSVLLGMMAAGLIHGSNTEIGMWIDDVYIDNTQARIELCDSDIKENITRCEPQIPVSWDSGKVEFSLNKGRFSDDETIYLYVIDRNNSYSPSFGPFITATDDVPADDTPVDDTPVDETPVDDTPVDETPDDEAPVDQVPADESPEPDKDDGGGGCFYSSLMLP